MRCTFTHEGVPSDCPGEAAGDVVVVNPGRPPDSWKHLVGAMCEFHGGIVERAAPRLDATAVIQFRRYDTTNGGTP